jgi:hypothetical protein
MSTTQTLDEFVNGPFVPGALPETTASDYYERTRDELIQIADFGEEA